MLRVWSLLGVLAALTHVGAAHAVPLPELTATARARVVHLSVRDARGHEEKSGSGFIISNDGRLATNYHVVHEAEDVVAVFSDEREATVTGVWAYDSVVDLAVLQLEPGKYQALTLAREPAKEGEDIVLVGSPLGLGNAVSTGIVSAVRKNGVFNEHNRDEGAKSWALQITAAAAPGSSGSPILRTDGEVVGVLAGHLSGMEGAYFGIAVERLRLLSSSAPAKVRPLNDVTGVRSVNTNLTISAALFAAVVLVWVAVVKWQGRARSRLG